MRGGALPPALICAALGFALAFAPRRAFALSLALLVAAAGAASLLPLPKASTETVFLGCWASVIVTAAAVHLPGGVGPRLARCLGLNAGAWTGAVIAVAGRPLDLVEALPCALLCIPGAWLVAGRRGIVIKVAASWLIAVSILAASLPLTPTPGYQPDHMD